MGLLPCPRRGDLFHCPQGDLRLLFCRLVGGLGAALSAPRTFTVHLHASPRLHLLHLPWADAERAAGPSTWRRPPSVKSCNSAHAGTAQ
eukprot:CAMPEP_0171081388 /NCGR_PEP_ID=MMETSP0766_2-20121228/16460_1 /TAXON_ID=439317 /ORGANISM="Gambierdiscus australes, Strain CAWD 149" /LENGTH=88 /DNA_ID=CAMNT_0011538685 /DNA_START=31 /DNA_END=297 /DNA_ORIENTATION=-